MGICRTRALAVLCGLGLPGCVNAPLVDPAIVVTPDEQAPLDVVQRRTAAYNAHNINAFIATYSEDVRIYEYPDKFLGEGTQRLRDIFGPQFAENDGSIIVHEQVVLEQTVVSNETVTFYGRTEHNIGIYTVSGGLITEVRLIEPHE